MWDERYSAEEYAYGKEPNDFLVEVIGEIPMGRVLCLAEGEGRNAVYLAEKGCHVVAVDSSAVGLQKAWTLASERGVTIETVAADLADYEIEPESWDAIVSIFCHLPPAVRKALHKKAISGLRPGGVFVLEAYTPRQLLLKTGGPPQEELMMDLDTLRTELDGLEFRRAEEVEREIHEGRYHSGRGAVVRVFGVKA